jgi:hypothetical protein
MLKGVSAISAVVVASGGVVEVILVDDGRVSGAEAGGVEAGICGEHEQSRKI